MLSGTLVTFQLLMNMDRNIQVDKYTIYPTRLKSTVLSSKRIAHPQPSDHHEMEFVSLFKTQ